MIKGTLYVEDNFLNNKIFCEKQNIQSYYKFSKYINIKKAFSKYNFKLDTQDITKESDADFVIYLDYLKKPIGKKNYLIVREPPVILPKNHDINTLNFFNKAFTWNDDLVNGKNIIKFQNGSYDFEKVKLKNKNYQKGYCLICSNKQSNKKNENYTTRFDIIDFFENKEIQFDLYGFGFDKRSYKSRYIEFLFNRLYFPRPKNNFKNYNGTIENKREIASRYKFQFAIENSKNIKGYISEKIFDSFFSNNIPLYSGASNISSYIPDDTFINIDEYNDIESLISFTESLSNDEITNIKKAQIEFFNSESIKNFDTFFNSEKITKHIMQDF